MFEKILSFTIGNDPWVRKLVVAALGLMALMGGAVGYWVETKPASKIPVFTVPPGPLKVRPAERGGLKLPDEELMDPKEAQSKVKLAPAPETPNTKLLQQIIGEPVEKSEVTPKEVTVEEKVQPKPVAKPEKKSLVPATKDNGHNFKGLNKPGWRVTIYSRDLNVTRAHEIWKHLSVKEGQRLAGIKPLYFYKGSGTKDVAVALEGVQSLTESNRLCSTVHSMGQHCDIRFVKKKR